MARRSNSSAFALPLVVVLVLVAGLVMSAMLARAGSDRLTVARQVEQYREYHWTKGVQEVLDAWLARNAGQITQRLGEEGEALEVELASGTVLVFSLRDNQGTLLRDLSTLVDPDFTLATTMLSQFRQTAAPGSVRSSTRVLGPMAVSVNSATPEVLRAAAMAAVNDELKAGDLADDLLERRAEKQLEAADLVDAMRKSDLHEQQLVNVPKALTAAPRLWKLTVDVRAGVDSVGPTARYEADVELMPAREVPARSAATAALRRARVLTWERVEERYTVQP